MILALREEDGRPPLLQGAHDIVEDHRVPRIVAGERGVKILDDNFAAERGVAERRLTDEEPMFERTSGGVRLGVHLKRTGPSCISVIR